MLGLLILGSIGTYQPQSQLSRMSTRLPTAAGGGNSSLPKYLTIYVLLAGIGGGLFFVVVVLYCCKICMGRRLSFDILSRESMKDNEGAAGGGGGGSGENQQHGNGTNGGNTSSTTGAGASSGMEKKTCVVQYSGGGTQILMTGGLQRKVSEEHQPSYPSSLSRSPRDVEGFKTCSNSGGGRGDDIQYKIGATPPHSPHYLTSTVISIEPAHNRNDSPSSSSSSLQLDHHSNKNSELPSPRSPKSRHNSGGSSLSRCGSRGSTARENRASMKSIPSRNSSFRRPVGGSLKDSKSQLRRARGGSSGDSYLTINHDSPRRSVSLRSPRHPPSRSPQSKEPNLLPLGLYIGSENSVSAGRRESHEHKKFNPSPTMSTHSVISGQWTPLEAGLEWWKRKHNLELVQYEGTEQSLSGKFRYNDIGSMEDIRGGDVSDYLFVDEDNVAPTMEIQPQQIKHQYRALWELRATLEEEDWAAAKNPPKVLRMPGGPSLSPTIPPKEDTQALLASSVSYSTEQSPDRDPLSSHTTSFESNTEPIFIDEPGAGPSGSREHKEVFHHLGPTSHASLASRRQSYKNVLHNRMKRIERSASIMQETGNVTETTTSFDSIETQESTSTDTSRLEAITTSIESTDNTDSTGDSHQYQQQLGKFQFRTDSGYKSLENGGPSTTNNQSNPLPAHRLLPRRCLSSGSSVDASSSSHSRQPLLGTTPRGTNNGNVNNTSPRSNDPDSTSPVFFAKVGQLPPSNHRNVTRKRREFGGRFERHSIGSMDSVREPLDEECGSGEGQGRAKGSLFYRYFKNPHPRSNSAYYTRDYSIDEKSDQLFREFSRCDPTFDMSSFTTTTSRPTGKIYCRRNSLARGATSLDLGSPQPRSNTSPNVSPNNSPYLTTKSLANKKPSPHDSVDDELPLLVTDNSRVLPLSSSRFHNVPAHASIPIITVDDS